MGEFYCNIQSDNGRLTDDHAVFKWGQLYRTAMEASDRNPRVGSSLQRLLTDAGLSNVQTHLFNIPIGTWPTGKYKLAQCLDLDKARFCRFDC